MSSHLITGGAGFIGSALARRLYAQGDEVVVLDRFSRGKSERLPKGIHTVSGDIRDQSAVWTAALGADVVWHLAYVQGTQTFYSDPKDVIDVALGGIVNLLGVIEAQGNHPDLFLVSTSEVYQNPPEGMFPTDETVPLSVPDVTNPRYSYGGGKIAQEIAVLAYSELLRRAVIVRPHNIYGPDMGFEHVIPEFAMRMNELVAKDKRDFRIQGTGLETRSFCFIEDCVDALIVLLDKGETRNVYHLGNPNEERAIKDLALDVADWFGHEIDIVPGKLPKGSPTRRLPDISKLKALGYSPKVSLADGLGPTLAWYKR